MVDMREGDPANLGILDRLLPEIRRLVFQMYFDGRQMQLDYPSTYTDSSRPRGWERAKWFKCYPTDLLQISKAIYLEAKPVEALTEVKLSFGDPPDYETLSLKHCPPGTVRNVTTAIEITSNSDHLDGRQGLDFQMYPQLRELSLAGLIISYPRLTLPTGNVDDLVKGRLDHHLLRHVHQDTEMSMDLTHASRGTPCVLIRDLGPVPCPSGLHLIFKPTVNVKLSEPNDYVDVNLGLEVCNGKWTLFEKYFHGRNGPPIGMRVDSNQKVVYFRQDWE